MRLMPVAALALGCLAAAPAAQRYSLQSDASDVSAKVAFFGLASKTAKFPKVSGTALLPAGDPSGMSLEVTLDARALEAPDKVTLSRLRGPKFFWVEKYPTVQFSGKGMAMTDERNGRVSGNLTARGITKPVTLDVAFDTPPSKARAGEALALTARTTIDRRDFGMTSYSLIVGRKVDIRIRTRMTPG
ncbi:YceI family protein [Qipengyuania soli]|uniref:YceI family protein n=2 Tax=Qipengyuania soli TaxID=2782568 RepID=A0A7S8F2R6_9SPHN|nr:YceI family protein [Qipengyuania soli]